MEKTLPSPFEQLPNELLIDICKYLDARDLYRAFYNLNSRFNTLLRSLNNLCLTLLKSSPNERNYYKTFASYIYTLKLGYKADIILNDFPNVRRLEFLVPSYDQMKQLQSGIYPYLEYLSIGYKHILFSTDLPNLCKKIFSNGFPYLKSCDLFEPKTVYVVPSSTQLTELCRLKVDNISFSTYQNILLTCPNLYFFQFTFFFRWKELLFIKPHVNLQRMIIKFEDFISSMDDYNINDYLSCVPTLQQLSIYRMDYAVNIKSYLNHNWLAGFIDHHLPLLKQFKTHLSIAYAGESFRRENQNLLNDIHENFKQMHKNRYRSELNIDLSTLLYYNN